jgi:wyosine [tRNA(Phe)-imidazoG37] synthetase (radical SAM superfamily)
MSVLELQCDIIYGPVYSRRLGSSLGINLLPTTRKLCTFDCIYCQYGSAEAVSLPEEKRGFPSVESVLRKVEEAIGEQPHLDYLTFSGNGEPTLHPHFPEIVAEVRRLRDRLCPHVRLAILSNSSRISRPEIRRAVGQLDDPIMKLDAGDPVTFAQINRPVSGIDFEETIAGLQTMPRLIIQSMIIAGPVQNVEGEAHEAWLATLGQLSPEKVQIYSTERPVATAGVQRVSREVLERLARSTEHRTGIEVRAY